MSSSEVRLERRAAQRFDFQLPLSIRLINGEREGSGLTQDLSARGAFFYTDFVLEQGANVAAHDDRGVLRRHNHTDQLLRSRSRLGYNISNKRRRETHTGHDMKLRAISMLPVQFLLQRRGLLARDAQER